MNKIVFVRRAFFTINLCVFYFSFILFPCLVNADPFVGKHGEVTIGIMENPNILNAIIPEFENISIRAIPPNVVTENFKVVEDFSPRGNKFAIRKNKNSGNGSDSRPDKAREHNFWMYIHVIFYSVFMILIYIHFQLRIDENRWYEKYMSLSNIITQFTCSYPDDINYKFTPEKGWFRVDANDLNNHAAHRA